MKMIFRLCFFLIPFNVFAHGYWIEADGTHTVKETVSIKLYFGEYITGERLSGKFLDRMKEIKVFVKINGKEEPVVMKQLENYWEGTYTPQSEGTYEITAINDEREVQDWTKHNLGIVRPIQYLATIYQVDKKKTVLSTTSFLNISIDQKQDKSYSILAFKNNEAYAAAKITITHPDKEETNLETDKDGKASFTLPKPGLYIIDVEWIDKTAGQFKGKDYESVRHKLDYSLYQL